MSSISSVAPYAQPPAASKTAGASKALGTNESAGTGSAIPSAAAPSPSTIVSVSPEAMAKSQEASPLEPAGVHAEAKAAEPKPAPETATSSIGKHISNGVTATKNFFSEAV